MRLCRHWFGWVGSEGRYRFCRVCGEPRKLPAASFQEAMADLTDGFRKLGLSSASSRLASLERRVLALEGIQRSRVMEIDRRYIDARLAAIEERLAEARPDLSPFAMPETEERG